jgi:hypothetical protein
MPIMPSILILSIQDIALPPPLIHYTCPLTIAYYHANILLYQPIIISINDPPSPLILEPLPDPCIPEISLPRPQYYLQSINKLSFCVSFYFYLIM